ncbi:polymeric immunoglobulin receptor-like [Colossoma macropomum]|uniref:polymeric immunoglobulin receptor-like n=1 Tax=Colossoma macropomum TaxID=42526 RepID=UPI001863C93B|nr:polymeric immunoglobulin receptor-like [Colossoma macropomum]XP_036412728.1 polymeric immunoglobulin receptor-like [Colossoma macropomum]
MRYHLLFIFFIPSIESRRWSERQLSLQTGRSITIPCHYDIKYIQHKKYWCYNAGAAFNYCTILAYENTTKDRVTVTDYPAQSLFTVTMRDLQSGDTGMYWCVVEIGGITEPDDHKDLYLTVQSDPDLSVVESSVSGQEGGSVSVQCLYSAGYQNEQKQWCRSKDWRCYTVGRTDPSQNSAVQISDDGRSSFSVEMSGLQKSDAGWYWCYIRDLQIPVYLSVTERHSDHSIMAVCLTVLLLLMVLAGVGLWIRRKRHTATEENQLEIREENIDQAGHTDTTEVSYSTVSFITDKKKINRRNTESQTCSPTEDPVTYCALSTMKPRTEL